MPIFKSRTAEPEVIDQPRKSGSFFNRNSTPPIDSHTTTTTTQHQKTGLFGRRSSTPERVSSETSSHHRSRSTGGNGTSSGFLGLGNKSKDASIVNAHQKVKEAEQAEAAADKALDQARRMVRDAREQVKLLEKESAEDARRAKAKQAEAKLASKHAKGLGRHGL